MNLSNKTLNPSVSNRAAVGSDFRAPKLNFSWWRECLRYQKYVTCKSAFTYGKTITCYQIFLILDFVTSGRSLFNFVPGGPSDYEIFQQVPNPFMEFQPVIHFQPLILFFTSYHVIVIFHVDTWTVWYFTPLLPLQLATYHSKNWWNDKWFHFVKSIRI